MKLTVETWPTEKLVEYARNPRKNDEQVDRMCAAIREFGFRIPIVAKSDGSVVDGHLRLKAARKLGLDEVPVAIADELSDEQVKAFRLLANQSANWASWDIELLKLELSELDGLGFDLALTGFDDDALAGFLADKTEGLTDPDATPEPPVNPVSVLGDVWMLGRHRVMCGDSLSIDAVNKLLQDAKADMVNTDPPYGVSYQSNMRTKSAKFDVLQNDDVILDVAPIIEACSTGWVFLWTTWKVLDKWLENTSPLGFPTNMVIWFKGGGGIGDLKKTFSTDYEMALVFNRGAELCGKRIGSVWTIGKDGAAEYAHPTQKPVALAQEAIDKTTRPSAVVLDLFGGSGSTLIACEQTGRDARLMELDPRYCDVIVKRWQDFTGEQATLEGDGRTFEEISSERYDPAKDSAGSYDAAIAAKREQYEREEAE